MAKKVRTIALFVIVAILVATFSAVSVVQAKTVNTVSSVQVVQNAQVDNCTLRWNKVSGADGYYIYCLNSKTNKYEKFKTIDSGKTKEVKLDKLTPSTVYNIKVAAFKIFRDKEYLGEMSSQVIVYTLPEKTEITVTSTSVGCMNVKWKSDKNVSAYELQYSQDSKFDQANTNSQELESSIDNKSIDSLTEKSTLFVRMRGYISVDGDKKYGEWSNVAKIQITATQLMSANIDKDKPMVALSFDDGPSFNGSTGKILDVLEKHGARATFFMVGNRITDTTKDYLKREIKLGCELGNHTYNHDHYGSQVTASDVSKCSDRIYKVTGQYPTAFRCPGGAMTSTMQNEAKKEGMVIAYWSVDTEDWKSKNPASIIQRSKDGVYDGSIILMHDIYETTAQAVEKVVPALIEKGYQIVTVSELIQAKTGKAPQAGQQYIDYKTINNNTH